MLWPRALLLLVSSTLAGPVERRQADRDFGPVQVTDADDPSMVTDVDDSSELPSNDGISTDFDNIESSQTIESPETITTPILTTGAPASVSITVTTAEDPEETDRPEETEEQDTAEEEDTTQIPPTVSDASPLISGFLTVQTPQPTDVEDVTSTVTVTWTQVAGRVETKAVSVTSVTTVTFTSTTLITSTITSGELDASTTTRYFTVTVPAIVHSGPALEPSTKRPDPNRRTAYIPGSAMVRLAKRATIFRTVTEILTETSVSTTTATRMVARRTSTIIVAKIAVTSIIQAVARATVTVDSTLTVTFPSVTRGVPISTTTVTLPTMVTSSTTENASDKSTETPLPAAGGLSNAGKGGIGGGVSVIGILAVAIGVSMWRKRRQKKAIPVAENPPEMAHGQPPNQSNNPFSDFGGITAHHAQELPAPQVPVAPVEVAATEEITQGKTQTLAPQNAEASGSSSVPELESRNAITEPATLSAPLKNDPGPSSTAPANGKGKAAAVTSDAQLPPQPKSVARSSSSGRAKGVPRAPARTSALRLPTLHEEAEDEYKPHPRDHSKAGFQHSTPSRSTPHTKSNSSERRFPLAGETSLEGTGSGSGSGSGSTTAPAAEGSTSRVPQSGQVTRYQHETRGSFYERPGSNLSSSNGSTA